MTLIAEAPVMQNGSDARRAMPASARRAMIDCQLRVSGVNDSAVLRAMGAVEREDFVPPALKANAYVDRALPLGGGAGLAAPLVHGRMLAEAALQPGEKVLIVSDSGYLAALVTAMGGEGTLISPADAAAKKNRGPYSLILIDGAAEVLPGTIAAMLANDGRVITGVVTRGITRLAAGRKSGNGVALMNLAEIGMPVLAAFAAAKSWSF